MFEESEAAVNNINPDSLNPHSPVNPSHYPSEYKSQAAKTPDYHDSPEYRKSLHLEGAEKEAILKSLRERLGMSGAASGYGKDVLHHEGVQTYGGETKYESEGYSSQKSETYESQKYEAPKYEAPKYEAPKYETEAPKYEAEAPKYETEAPKNETEAPKYENPKYEVPEEPKYEEPKYEEPASEEPKYQERPPPPKYPEEPEESYNPTLIRK